MDLSSASKLDRRLQLNIITTVTLTLIIIAITKSTIEKSSLLILICEFLGSALTAILVTFTIYKAFIEEASISRDELLDRLLKIKEISPDEINQEFDKEIINAKYWTHNGNFGRYVRSKILSENKKGSPIRTKIILMYPSIENCISLSEFQKSIHLSPNPESENEPNEIQAEILTTVAIFAQQNTKYIGDAIVFVRDHYKPYRADFYESGVFITQEGLRNKAIKLDKALAAMYEPLLLEAEHDLKQSKAIKLPIMETSYGSKLTEDDAKNIISATIPDREIIGDKVGLINKMIKKTGNKPKSPYAENK